MKKMLQRTCKKLAHDAVAWVVRGPFRLDNANERMLFTSTSYKQTFIFKIIYCLALLLP